MIKLTVMAEGASRLVEVTETTLFIGRAAECAVKITDLKASRRHAKLERMENAWRITDLESASGTWLNGAQTLEAVLQQGDEIRVGETVITVTELDTPPVARTRPATEIVEKVAVPLDRKREVKSKIDGVMREIDRARQPFALRLLKWVGAAAILLGMGAVLFFVGRTAFEGAKNRPVARTQGPMPKSSEAATRALEELRMRAEAVTEVSPALVADVSRAAEQYGRHLPVAKGQMNGFDLLLGSLLQRRAAQFSKALAAVRVKIEESLTARAYSDAMATIAAFQDGLDSSYEEAVRALVAEVDAAVGEDFAVVMAYGTRLEEAARESDAASHYALHAPRFQGTPFEQRIVHKSTDLAELARLSLHGAPAGRDAVAAGTPETSKPEAGSAAPVPIPVGVPAAVIAPLSDAIAAGKLAERTVKIDDKRSGKAVSTDDAGLTLQTPAGPVTFAWTEVAPALVLRLAESLQGDDLIAVAEYGYAHSLAAEAEKLLLKLFNADRKANKDKVESALARGRGLVNVPAGGYNYDPKHGFEDASQRDNRLAVDAGAKIMKDLVATTDAKKRDGLFAKFMEIYDKGTLTTPTREMLKTHAVASLGSWKKKNIDALSKKAGNRAMAGLAQLKQRLNQARKDALALIYDESIYLREDHPDWRNGDKINGQEKVDELVDVVRKIWEDPMSVAMPASVKSDVEEIREVNQKYLAALGERVDTEAELKALEDITNNLNARIDIKSYCMNGAEVSLYNWNRRCDKYNEACADDGVTKEEKDHALVLNDYREMMGRKRLFLDGRICKATKKHSAVCDAAGQIWHVGSDGSPQSRAAAEGFTAGVGENVAIGYGHPSDVWWRGWYRASDHHRNGLSDSWNCLGYGYSGSVGTQNFSNIAAPKGF